MNICLISPSTFKKSRYHYNQVNEYLIDTDRSSHIGLGYLHSALERAGHHVITFDFEVQDLTNDDIEEVIIKNHVEAVGLSVYGYNLRSAISISRMLRKYHPDIFLFFTKIPLKG